MQTRKNLGLLGKGLRFPFYSFFFIFQGDFTLYVFLMIKMLFLLRSPRCQATVNFTITSLPNDDFFDWTKFKTLTEDNFIIAKIMISVFGRVENIVGKGENTGY